MAQWAYFSMEKTIPFISENLQTSVLSLFRIALSLEDWTDVMYINMYGSDNYGYSEGDLQNGIRILPIHRLAGLSFS